MSDVVVRWSAQDQGEPREERFPDVSVIELLTVPGQFIGWRVKTRTAMHVVLAAKADMLTEYPEQDPRDGPLFEGKVVGSIARGVQ